MDIETKKDSYSKLICHFSSTKKKKKEKCIFFIIKIINNKYKMNILNNFIT